MINQLEAAEAAARTSAQAVAQAEPAVFAKAIDQPEWSCNPTAVARASDPGPELVAPGGIVTVGVAEATNPVVDVPPQQHAHSSGPTSAAPVPGKRTAARAPARAREPDSESSHGSRGSFPGQALLGWIARRSSNGRARSGNSARSSGGAANEVHTNPATYAAVAQERVQPAPSPAASISPPPPLFQPTGTFAEQLQARARAMNRL